MMKYVVRVVFLFAFCVFAGCGSPHAGRDVLFEVGTVDALLDGAYDGAVTMAELLEHGDTGLGTFRALDGELVCVDGAIYQVRADGHAYAVSDRMTTPFAAVTWMDPDYTMDLGPVEGLAALEAALDGLLPTPNAFYAIRVDGEFDYVRTRSVPAQRKPYPPLAEVAEHQPTFEFHSVRGTLVGFRCPHTCPKQGVGLFGKGAPGRVGLATQNQPTYSHQGALLHETVNQPLRSSAGPD